MLSQKLAAIALATLVRNPGRDADARIERARALVEAVPEQIRQRSQIDLLLATALAGMGRMNEAREVADSITWIPDAAAAVSIIPVVGSFAAPGYADSVQQELDAVQPVERLLPRQGVDLARRRQAAQDRQVIARLLLAEDRRLRLGCVGPDQPRQQVEPRSTLENRHPTLAPRPPAQLRPDFGTPAADGFFVV